MKSEVSSFVRRLIGRRFIIPVIVVFMSLATLAVSANVWRSVALKPESAGLNAGPSQTSRRQFPIVLTNLTRFGFEPSAMRVPAGRCLLAVRNISGKETVELRVKRSDNGQTLAAEQHRTGKRHWEKFMEFGVGEYLITEAGNPEWTLRLTVFPPEKQ